MILIPDMNVKMMNKKLQICELQNQIIPSLRRDKQKSCFHRSAFFSSFSAAFG